MTAPDAQRAARTRSHSTPSSLTQKRELQALVREAIIAELEREHYARKLTNADVAVIIAAVADTKFHETYDYILASIGPHLAAAITVLETFARPDGIAANAARAYNEPGSIPRTSDDRSKQAAFGCVVAERCVRLFDEVCEPRPVARHVDDSLSQLAAW